MIRPSGSSSLFRLAGAYTYRETERSNGGTYKSTDRYDAEFLYRYTFDNDWFVQNLATWRVDHRKGIDRELANLVGVGYSFHPLKKLEFNLGVSAGVEDFQLDADDNRNGSSGVVNVFEELTWRPMKRTSLVHRFGYFWDPEDSNQYKYVTKTALRLRMTDLLGFEFSYNKDYDNDTGQGNNKDDTRWLNALILFF